MFDATGIYQLLPPLTHNELNDLRESIKEKGVLVPIIEDEHGNVIDGHHRKMICEELGIDCPKTVIPNLTEEEKRSNSRMLNITRRQLNTEQKRFIIIGELEDHPTDSNNSIAKRLGVSDTTVGKIRKTMNLDNINVVGADGKVYKQKGAAITKFGIPPFTILDATSGRWKERKSWWKNWGIESELARDATAFSYKDGKDPISLEMQDRNHHVSIFDPVLTEMMIRWHSPQNGLIYDPFAGGPVRGIIAAALGRKYIGTELREEQVEANYKNSNNLKKLGIYKEELDPIWICGDSSVTPVPENIDMILTCPPYWDLEVYSDDISDISNMNEEDFNNVYQRIIQRSVENMKEDSFAIFVVGNKRRKNGTLFDLVGLTIKSLEESGANYYSEYILRTPVGTGSIRLNQYTISRKPIKLHQNVIVAVKGNGRAAAEKCDWDDCEWGDISL